MPETVRCSECGGFFAESGIVKHLVDEHPTSVVARAVELVRSREVTRQAEQS